MSGNAQNIITGTGSILIDDQDIGFTTGGVTLRYDLTTIEIEGDQALGIIDRRKSNERLYVTFNALELTLENMRRFMGLPAGLLTGSCLYLGYNSTCSENSTSQVELVGEGPNCCNRRWTFPTAVISTGFEIQLQKENPAQMSVEYEVLKDGNGRFGFVCDAC